jgi:hypothetical protein
MSWQEGNYELDTQFLSTLPGRDLKQEVNYFLPGMCFNKSTTLYTENYLCGSAPPPPRKKIAMDPAPNSLHNSKNFSSKWKR